MGIFDRIKNNHLLMMLLCCAIPLIALFVIVRYFGITNSYIYWLVLFLCVLSHLFMMKHMHKSDGKGGKCH